MFSLQNATAGAIAFGVEKHKALTKWAIGEAVANITLSIFLARKIGIYGVALGTLIPNLCVQLIMWPFYVSRFVDITFLQVYRNVWGPVFLCAVPFAIASYAVDVSFPPHRMVTFLLQTMALLPIFAITTGVAFRDSVRRQIFPMVRSRFLANAK
jgi:O-antigen/teichoic acid export membrane protein